MNDIQDVVLKAKEFANTMTYTKGWYAGSSQGFWVKCDNQEVAIQTGLQYIFFIDRMGEVVIYKA